MTKQISPLRQRMIEDMTIRNISPSTQKIYVAAVANFSLFHQRSPDKLTFEDVRNYRLHLISRGLKPNSINPIMGALRFFYRTTLGLKEVPEQIPYARRADPLPAVLAREEVVRLLKAVSDLRMRTLLITIYAAGLRVSEAVKLTARDIDINQSINTPTSTRRIEERASERRSEFSLDFFASCAWTKGPCF